MLIGLFALAILIAKLFPATPAGRATHRYLVELPLELAARVERRHVILVAILLIGGQALILAAPIDLAIIYALDLSLYVDAAIAVSAAAAVARVKGAWSAFKSRLRGFAVMLHRSDKRTIGTRPARTNPRRIASNDQDDDRASRVRNAA